MKTKKQEEARMVKILDGLTHEKIEALRNTPAHTPTPWKIFNSEYGIGLGKDNSDTQIFYFKTLEEAVAKLADIAPNQVLRAVNAHQEMLDALKAVKQYADIPGDVMSVVKDAIAKAEGK